MVVINRSLRSAGGSGGSFNIESVILDEETQKLSIVSTKENTTVDKETPVTQVSLDGRKLPVVNGRYNIVSTMSEDGKSQILDITDWNYSNLPTFDEVFANNTPEQISAISAEIAKNGYTSDQVYELFGWSLGDTISIPLISGEIIEMQIIGFNHDTLSSDHISKAGITLHMKNCLEISYPMNSARQNKGGYPASLMKTETLPTLKALLPQEWQDVIKLVDKKSANGNSSSYTETVTLSEDLFLPSAIEVADLISNSVAGDTEGAKYEYYSLAADSLAYLVKNQGSEGSAVRWWLRSVHTTSTPSFCAVSAMGAVTSYRAEQSIGVAFAFCV